MFASESDKRPQLEVSKLSDSGSGATRLSSLRHRDIIMCIYEKKP